jgi:DNA-binding transcriptional regulator YdaS (Cro superfamily)
LSSEAVVLREVGHIETTTLDLIMLQIRDGLDQGLGPTAIKQNITDVAAFAPSRALRIARTVTGTAQSIGQLIGAELAGATVKIWQTAFDGNVRDTHSFRSGEEAPIDGVFGNIPSSNGVYPRYPLDPELAPGDRVNCRCSMVFRV